uniref:Radical SAM protein n=1 Tax=candidate division WOR-3 bacterium TaxID=2052148 RepID=A0A7C6EBG4_UNCW3
MARCLGCHQVSITISRALNLCVNCLRERFDEFYPKIQEFHRTTRLDFNLPEAPPKNGKRKCQLCINQCRFDGYGYCGEIEHKASYAWLDYYFDPLPTNCVADWVCPGSKEIGFKNLAVFFRSCTFNCLFCQNWHFKNPRKRKVGTEELLLAIDEKTNCICYFGGDPTPSLPFAINLSNQIRKQKKDFRICWETNGSMNSKVLKKMIELSLVSNGILKIDFKTYSKELSYALCGVSNEQTLKNIKLAATYIDKRPELPILVLSTLLVPGYIDTDELENMAKFIAELNPNIPWALLAFHPQFRLADLPTTSQSHAEQAMSIAKEYGIKNVRIGNISLLGGAY